MTPNGPDKKEYERRRRAVQERIAEERAVLFIPGAAEAVYSNDVHYKYRPDSNIRYLTGFEEPATLIVSMCGDAEDGFTLLVPASDPQAEIWTGHRAGVDGAKSEYGADHAYPIEKQFEVLGERLKSADKLYFSVTRDAAVNQRVFDCVRDANVGRPRSGATAPTVSDTGELLDEMRLFKTSEEIEVLARACEISAAAHRRVMETVRPGMPEYRIEALLEFEFRNGGCAGPAYGTIAAGGENATTLHYTNNDAVLADETLLLVDAGGEYGGYCADITRTTPVGRAYSKPQAALYDTVLAAQEAAIALAAPGNTVEDVHDAALSILIDGLTEHGLLEGDQEEIQNSGSYKRYYMHRTSHWLGMDVHDVGRYAKSGSPRPLEPGMVLTVEPGLYIPGDDGNAEYRGIGIRIEDDVLVTPDGPRVLTDGAPKSRAEVEAIRAKAFTA
jgi:Xaa-Pro aminopeptidase